MTQEPTIEKDEEKPRMKMSELLSLLTSEKNKVRVKEQLEKVSIGSALKEKELRDLRVKDIARDSLMSDLADNVAAAWKRDMKLSELSETKVLMESNLFGGIFDAPHKQIEWPIFPMLLVIGVVIASVTLIYIQPIMLWVKTVLLPDPVEQYAVAAFIVFLIILGIIWFRRRKKGGQ